MEATTLSRKRIFHGKCRNARHSVRHGARRQVAPHANFVDFGGNRQSPEAQRNGTTAHYHQKTHHLSVVSRRIARLKGKWGKSSQFYLVPCGETAGKAVPPATPYSLSAPLIPAVDTATVASVATTRRIFFIFASPDDYRESGLEIDPVFAGNHEHAAPLHGVGWLELHRFVRSILPEEAGFPSPWVRSPMSTVTVDPAWNVSEPSALSSNVSVQRERSSVVSRCEASPRLTMG